MKAKIVFKGGKGSGNFGHAGRPGKVGGSAPSRAGKKRGVFGNMMMNNVPGDGKFDDTPARTFGQKLRKGLGQKYKMERGADNENASFSVSKPRFGQTAYNKEVKTLKRNLEAQGFEEWKNPLRTAHFYEKSGGQTWRNGNMMVEISGSPSTKLNPWGRLNIDVNRADITHTQQPTHIPYD